MSSKALAYDFSPIQQKLDELSITHEALANKANVDLQTVSRMSEEFLSRPTMRKQSQRLSG